MALAISSRTRLACCRRDCELGETPRRLEYLAKQAARRKHRSPIVQRQGMPHQWGGALAVFMALDVDVDGKRWPPAWAAGFTLA